MERQVKVGLALIVLGIATIVGPCFGCYGPQEYHEVKGFKIKGQDVVVRTMMDGAGLAGPLPPVWFVKPDCVDGTGQVKNFIAQNGMCLAGATIDWREVYVAVSNSAPDPDLWYSYTALAHEVIGHALLKADHPGRGDFADDTDAKVRIEQARMALMLREDIDKITVDE